MVHRISVTLISLAPWIIAFITAITIISERWMVWCLGISAVVLLLGVIVRWRVIQKTPFNLPLLSLLLLGGLSFIFVSPSPDLTTLPTAYLLLAIILYFAWSEFIVSSHALVLLVRAFFLAIFFLGLFVPFFIEWTDKFTFWPAFSEVMPKIAGGLNDKINANVAGGAFAALFAMTSGALFFGWKALGSGRLAILLLVALLGLDMAITQTRAAILAAILALVLLFVLRWKWGWLLIVLGGIIAAGILTFVGPGAVWQSLLSSTGGNSSFSMREEIWFRVRLLISDFPLSGVGIGTFPSVINALYPLGGIADHAHNLYLQLAADLGLPGLFAWLGCFFTTVWMAWSLLHRRAAGALYPALGAAALGFNAVLATHGLLDCVLWDTRPAVLVWAVWGLTAAGWKLSNSPSPGSPAKA